MNDTVYLIIGILTVLAVLAGISAMSRVRSARAGNAIGAIAVAVVLVVTLCKHELLGQPMVLVALIVGTGLGAFGALRVKMIQMPQFVALLNGLGGLASALVAYGSLNVGGGLEKYASQIALAVGLLTASGSAVAAGKLARMLPQRPVILKGHSVIVGGLLLLTVIAIIAKASTLVVIASLLFGVFFSIRVGGADMPITISLLNSLSGVAGGVAGIAIGDPVLTCIGGVVGASGLLLTQIMGRAMNRSLANILLGRTTVTASAKGAHAKPEAAASAEAAEAPAADNAPAEAEPVAPMSAEDRSALLKEILSAAKDVIIVPGYGMALAQAQASVKKLADTLTARGAKVRYAIHPVAGRMPGHMNVLLCEVDVPYEQLFELDDINSDFATCDVVVVVGANDTINPAANTAEGTPIYGMPVLAVGDAPHTIVCNLDDSPGYAGVPNSLYQSSKSLLMFGDAKATLAELLDLLK
ncbi:MAG: NAD(P) transhydrogenase subunit beta [Lentisphaerae bacterium ADurb.Bin082]|nr:MAG: NAD(P) transhydrogenase subunit beta [Lentisphaerae bacterium ADurb.Bin082]HQL86429.1 NAD(P)(+) transhydrogenase (Re/Si-specific) subunit beta [Lentisphaeria bacterium]